MERGLRYVRICLLIVVALRVVLLLTIDLWSDAAMRGGLAPVIVGGDDGDYYYETAKAIASGDSMLVPNAYPLAVGGIMALTGITSVLFYKLLNCLAGCLVIWVAIAIFSTMPWMNRRAISASRTGTLQVIILLVGLYPMALFAETFSLTRDAWIYLFHIAAVYYSLKLICGNRGRVSIGYALPLAVCMLCLMSLRWYASASLVCGWAMWLVWRLLSRFTSRARASWVTLVVALVAIMILFGVRNSEFVAESNRYETLRSYRGSVAGGSDMGIDLSQTSVYQFPVFYLYSFASNAFGPLPWQVRSATTGVTLIVEVPILVMVAYLIWRRRKLLDSGGLYLLCQAIVWFALISLFNDNIGTAARLRVLGWHCLFILYAWLRYRSLGSRPQRQRLAMEELASGGSVPRSEPA